MAACAIPASPACASLAGVLLQRRAAAGIQFRLVEAHAAVRDLLGAEGLDERVGPLSRRIAVGDIVESFRTPDVG